MSSQLTSDDLRAIALKVLRREPDPTVRVRLLRDVLRVSEHDARLSTARGELDRMDAVRLLAAEQRHDGGWGRLHSRDTRASQRTPTTEWAVERATELGVDRWHPMLQRAAEFLAGVVEGRLTPSDPPERNDRWRVGVELFAASTLAWIDPGHSVLLPTWRLWSEIVRRSFADGAHDADAEAAAHHELTGASVRGTYLVSSNRYAVALLGSRAEQLDGPMREAVARWIWSRPEGIGYFGVPLSSVPKEGRSAGHLENWLRSHEHLSRFRTDVPITPLIEWLDTCRRGDGLWDLGARTAFSAFLPLSASWRTKDARAIDWTTRVLVLLARWID
jgi:hypothetical protein